MRACIYFFISFLTVFANRDFAYDVGFLAEEKQVQVSNEIKRIKVSILMSLPNRKEFKSSLDTIEKEVKKLEELPAYTGSTTKTTLQTQTVIKVSILGLQALISSIKKNEKILSEYYNEKVELEPMQICSACAGIYIILTPPPPRGEIPV